MLSGRKKKKNHESSLFVYGEVILFEKNSTGYHIKMSNMSSVIYVHVFSVSTLVIFWVYDFQN